VTAAFVISDLLGHEEWRPHFYATKTARRQVYDAAINALRSR
jgi:hypothetical protein